MVRSTGKSKRSASCAVPNEPTAANVAWHNEIWPARPVITVIERKMSEKITALVTISSQKSLITKSESPSPTITTAAPSPHVR